jgi:hypothetical protein
MFSYNINYKTGVKVVYTNLYTHEEEGNRLVKITEKVEQSQISKIDHVNTTHLFQL